MADDLIQSAADSFGEISAGRLKPTPASSVAAAFRRRYVRTVNSRYAAPAPNRIFGAHAASIGATTPPVPSAAKTLNATHNVIAMTMPAPMQYIAARRPAL